VAKTAHKSGRWRPERRFYTASKQPTSEVSIRRRLNEDLYLNLAGNSNDGDGNVLQCYVFPLVSWIWMGYWVVLFGTIHLPDSEQVAADLSAHRSGHGGGSASQDRTVKGE